MSLRFFKLQFSFSVNMKDILKYSTPHSLSNLVLKNTVEFLKVRCAGLGFVPLSRTSFDQKNEEIKLFGDYTMRIDTAVWKVLKEHTAFDEVFLSKEEILLLIFQILKGFELENDQELLKKMKSKVFGDEFRKINDIIIFLEEVKKTMLDESKI